MAKPVRETIIQPVNVGGVASEFILAEGWSEDPSAPTDCRTVAMRGQFDLATGQNRKAYRHILTSAAQKKLKNRAKHQLDKIERENKKALRAMRTAPQRISFFKTF